MKKRLNGFPIAREKFFILTNGTYVIQWNDHTVQALFSGRTYPYRREKDYGAPVSDFELKQMKSTKCISHFNRQYIWLSSNPQHAKAKGDLTDAKRATQISRRISSETGRAAGAAETLTASALSGITAPSAVPDRTPTQTFEAFSDNIDTGQMIRSMMPSRQVLLILQNPREQDDLRQLLTEMQFEVLLLPNAQQALLHLEEHTVDLLIADLELPDMHAWQMIAKLNEISPYASTPVLIIADEIKTAMRSLIGDHICRPVSIPRLRYHIWKVLQSQSQFNKPLLKISSKGDE